MENKLSSNNRVIAGVDEVGRGPLAGPVVAAAVILPDDHELYDLTDSKKLSEKKRESLNIEIKQQAIAWSIASADIHEIDSINILQASLLAMKRAVESLSVTPVYVLVDGTHCPDIAMPVEAIIKGDSKIAAISAASILAKVYRDNLMIELAQQYPDYGFAKHKGYPTQQHLEALAVYGVTPVHRQTFAPVRKYLG